MKIIFSPSPSGGRVVWAEHFAGAGSKRRHQWRVKRPACLPMSSSATSLNRKLSSLETRLHQSALLAGKVSIQRLVAFFIC